MEAKLATATEGQPLRCKAAICRKPGSPLSIEEIIVAAPMPGEARIRVICTTLCHTDLTFWKMQISPENPPRILGHEVVGVVESVGENVTEFTKGDFVIPTFLSECGECIDCKSSTSNLCSNFPFEFSTGMPRDGTSRFKTLKGEIIQHFMFVSSFSEYTVVDITQLAKIDAPIPPQMACLLSCGVSTGVGAAWISAGVKPGSTIAVFGLGTIGCAVVEGARLRGATRIIGVDVNPEKYEIAKKFGLTDFVHYGGSEDKSVSQIIKEMTGGGADYSFECFGEASLMEEAYASCRKGWGKTIVIGLVENPEAKLSLSCTELLLTEKSLKGCLFGGFKPKSHVPILIKRYMDKELNLEDFVTHEVQFQDINKAFDLLIEGKSLRCVIWMDK